MSARDPEDTATRASQLIDQEGGLSNFLQNVGVGGISFALILSAIDAIDAAGELLLAPWRALAEGIVSLVGGTLGSAVDIVDAGGSTAVDSFTDGLAAILGPFAFPAAVLIVMVSVYLFIQAALNIELSPRVFLSDR
jgi:hypothetical protein